MPLFLLSYWKQLLGGFLLVSVLYFGYYEVKQIGYREATVEYQEQLKAYNARLDAHIKTLEENSTTLATEISKHNVRITKGIAEILETSKGKPPYVIIDGKCAPSDNFIATYNSLIRKANE